MNAPAPPQPTTPPPGIPERAPNRLWRSDPVDGTMLIPPSPTTPHVCRPPGQRSAIRHTEYPRWQARTESVSGGLWRCTCGQHWQGVDQHWQPISARRARRLMKATQ